MLNFFYQFVTPLGKANKLSFFINKVLGKIANYIYPLFCMLPHRTRKTVSANNNHTPVIVTLTSFPGRIDKLWICTQTLLNQTLPPDKILLWLAESQFPQKEADLPRRLLKQKKQGLEIRFCEDIRSFKKIYYTARDYPDAILVTADDDVLYPENWLKELYKTYHTFGGVCCYRAHELLFDEHRNPKPYLAWNGLSNGIQGPSLKLVPTGVGGVLYPPNIFQDALIPISDIKRICPSTDDLWLKIISLLKHIPVTKVRPYSKEWFTISKSQKHALLQENCDGSGNDVQLKNLTKYYDIDLYQYCNELKEDS